MFKKSNHFRFVLIALCFFSVCDCRCKNCRKIRFMYGPPIHPQHKARACLCEVFNEATKGEIEVQVYFLSPAWRRAFHDGTGADRGTLHMTAVTSGVLSNFVSRNGHN
jgi:TRAP-type C4-dicarboxylate transport system substrate-binding protein